MGLPAHVEWALHNQLDNVGALVTLWKLNSAVNDGLAVISITDGYELVFSSCGSDFCRGH